MRGGTSRALLFRREDLPVDPAEWEAIFLAAIGSPDSCRTARRLMEGSVLVPVSRLRRP
jgi:2-methylaconitate cis-trans-isomerase PrpF